MRELSQVDTCLGNQKRRKGERLANVILYPIVMIPSLGRLVSFMTYFEMCMIDVINCAKYYADWLRSFVFTCVEI
jgi:hypothetical protein